MTYSGMFGESPGCCECVGSNSPPYQPGNTCLNHDHHQVESNCCVYRVLLGVASLLDMYETQSSITNRVNRLSQWQLCYQIDWVERGEGRITECNAA